MKSAYSEEALFFSKIEDGISLSQKRPHFIGFFNDAELFAAKTYLKQKKDISVIFCGGYDESERQMMGFYPEFIASDKETFPLTALTFLFRKEDLLSHKDFLGALMSLGIERTVIGDILTEPGRAVVFLKKEMKQYVIENLDKVGRIGVKIFEGYEKPLPVLRKYEEVSGVISSARMDCMVAFLSKTSREKAVQIISSKSVLKNYKEVSSVSEKVAEGDIITIRKKGKFVLDSFGTLTSKGKLTIRCRKYM